MQDIHTVVELRKYKLCKEKTYSWVQEDSCVGQEYVTCFAHSNAKLFQWKGFINLFTLQI